MSELDEFEAYIAELATALGHADREVPFRGYTTGLLLPLERKSVEPPCGVRGDPTAPQGAARVEPARVGSAHRSLHHFVAEAAWSDAALLAAVRASVLPAIVGHGPIEAWIVDDTGMPKKGRHSVGVARQYCGQLGKQENCQVAVSLSVATAAASLPAAWRLYLPREWAEDVERRTKAGVPAELAFRRNRPDRPTAALEQIEAALAAGIPRGVVLAAMGCGAGYGADMTFRVLLAEIGLQFIVGVQPRAKIWINGKQPLPPKAWSGQNPARTGRPPSNLRRDADHQPVEAKTPSRPGLGPCSFRRKPGRTSSGAEARKVNSCRDPRMPASARPALWGAGSPQPRNMWGAGSPQPRPHPVYWGTIGATSPN